MYYYNVLCIYYNVVKQEKLSILIEINLSVIYVFL